MSKTKEYIIEEYIIEEFITAKYLIKIDASSKKEAEEKYLSGDYDHYQDRNEEDSTVDDYEVFFVQGGDDEN